MKPINFPAGGRRGGQRGIWCTIAGFGDGGSHMPKNIDGL